MGEIERVYGMLSKLDRETPDLGRPKKVDPVSFNWGFRECLRYLTEWLEEEWELDG